MNPLKPKPMYLLYDVTGEAQTNPDGTVRQDEIRRCGEGDDVSLVPEPDNPFDKNAVKVVSERGICVGYIARTEVKEIGRFIRDGRLRNANINRIFGGGPGQHYGVRVRAVILPER
jgi:hypothetical protein